MTDLKFFDNIEPLKEIKQVVHGETFSKSLYKINDKFYQLMKVYRERKAQSLTYTVTPLSSFDVKQIFSYQV